MDTGIDFLREQVANAVVQHRSYVQALEHHESQARDQRYRDLCSRFIPPMRDGQRMLEQYQQELGASGGFMERALASAMRVARDLADVAAEGDFQRLLGDILMSSQSEDLFRTFREAGRSLGIQRLAEIGDTTERLHDSYAAEANRLVQQMFVEHARGAESALGVSAAQRPRASG